MKLLKLGSVLFLSILCCVTFVHDASPVRAEVQASEAPTGFDNLTNGMVDQPAFDEVKEIFEETESIADGIGPVYNALSCTECHQNPITGGNSQIVEVRSGHWNGQVFTDHPGGSLIHSRSIDASVQEHIMDGNEVRAFRAATSVLGLGFVEAIRDETLISIANAQPFQSGGLIRGQIVRVDVIEAPGVTRVGRFGWKNQQASLLSFSADAYINEMGITTPMAPTENNSNGSSIELFDRVPLDDPTAPDDEGIDDLEAFTVFMRASKAPSRDTTLAATTPARAGAALFNQIGCAVCHVTTITTAPAGTSLNGGSFVVPDALGNKIIHPYSDFLLHDVGTGDGIVQGLALTRNRMRTPPLWGLRTKNRLMHDGLSMTFNEAILRHSGEAGFVVLNYRFLSNSQRDNLLTFLRSL